MEKKTYTILQTTPRLGKAGGTVELSGREAKYWLQGGVIAGSAKAAIDAKAAPKGKSRKG